MASFFLHYFLINVLIIFPAISLRPFPLLLVILNNSLISLLNEFSLEYDSNTLLIIGATSAEPAPWFSCSNALFRISVTNDGAWFPPIMLLINSLILSSAPLLPEVKTFSSIFLAYYTSLINLF